MLWKRRAVALAALAATPLVLAIWNLRRRRKWRSSVSSRRGRRRLCVATRVHQQQASKPIDPLAVKAFFESSICYGDSVVIAVGEAAAPSASSSASVGTESAAPSSLDGAGATAARSVERIAVEVEAAAGRAGVIHVIALHPWGNFVPALNALLAFAAADKADLLLYQSLETAADSETVAAMARHLDPASDLVVGAALQGHDFTPGPKPVALTGLTTPWNTLALWSVPRLARLGFLAVAEGLLPGVDGGIEEVTAIAALQMLAAARSRRRGGGACGASSCGAAGGIGGGGGDGNGGGIGAGGGDGNGGGGRCGCCGGGGGGSGGWWGGSAWQWVRGALGGGASCGCGCCGECGACKKPGGGDSSSSGDDDRRGENRGADNGGCSSGGRSGGPGSCRCCCCSGRCGGGPMRAKLLRLPGVSWEARWADDGRRRWHERKMASKASRAAAQMAALGLPEGAVYHIEYSAEDDHKKIA